MKSFVIDVTKCVGCRNCQIVCKDEHVGNDWLPYAKSQPLAGQFWMNVKEEERGSIPKVRVAYTPVMCQHCVSAPCLPACNVRAIDRREDGLVIIDPVKCTGCMNCIDACPYGAIYFNKDLKIAQKCTGCAHLLDQYGWTTPRCVDACPTDAIKFGEEEELAELIGKSEVLHPEYNTNPRVHYIGLPKSFIAGTVYDPVNKEIVEGASCTLTDSAGAAQTVQSDGFGDFWFEGLAEGGVFSLKIEAAGFPAKSFDSLSTVKDINLGDIPLG
jgi:Fe-S-cluster-containing dehydrogenase component